MDWLLQMLFPSLSVTQSSGTGDTAAARQSTTDKNIFPSFLTPSSSLCQNKEVCSSSHQVTAPHIHKCIF